jgi:PmbA protein
MEDLKNISDFIIKEAKRVGADEVDVVLISSINSSIKVRLGKIEELKQSSPKGVGIRVIKKKHTALTNTSDFREDSLKKLVKQTVEMANITSVDKYSGLPEKDLLGIADVSLDLYDSKIESISTDKKINMMRKLEEIGMSQDPLIKNSEGAQWEDSKIKYTLANSKGFHGEQEYTSCSYSLSLVAEKKGVKQTDYWWTASRFFDKLDPIEDVAKEAAKRTLRKIGSAKPKTKKVPVVFDPDIGADFLRIIASCVLGSSIYRKNSFLVDRLNEQIAVGNLDIIDDGIMLGGLGSRKFDGEGLPSRKNIVVENGILKTYLCDCYSARKLDHPPTGNASRGIGSEPGSSPTNFYMRNGNIPPEDIIASVKDGLYLTGVHWVGVNYVTGDYSRGAEGIWIKNGKLDHPVQEFTVAGNMPDMMKSIEAIGDDLKFRSSINSPTFMIKEMMISGT